MKRLTTAAVALSLAGCAFADPAGNPWVVEDDPAPADPVVTPADDPTEPDNPVVVEPTEPLSCTLEFHEFQETWWVSPHFDGFSPNEGLYVAATGYDGQAVTMSVVDGEKYGANDLNGLRDVSSNWGSGVLMTNDPGAEWRDLTTGEVLYAADGAVGSVAISDDGQLAAFVVCSDEATLARIVDTSGAAREVEISSDGYCRRWSVNRNHMDFTSDGNYLVVSTMGGALWTIDTTTLETATIDPHAVLEEPEIYYGTMISDMAVRPGASEVVTTGADGFLRRWSVPSLEQIGDDLEVGASIINEMTYAPHYTVSPVAFSADGQTMAFMNTDNDVVLRNAGGDEVLPTPEMAPEDMSFERAANVPVTISFGPSGRRVGIGYYWGPAVWGCPGDSIQRRGSLSLDVPAVVELRDSQTRVPLDIDGAGPISAIRVLTADREAYYQAQFVDGALNFWARHEQPAEETVIVEVDDGYATASAAIQLRYIQ